jgi:multisubunit Na+/H+ antiporter MnhB subunit
MIKNIKLLLTICVVSIFIILGLQYYWATKYYNTVSYNYERDINLAYEDAIRKDFIIRCDTIEKILEEKILDTLEYRITSSFDKNLKIWKYKIFNKHDSKDNTTFTPYEGEKKQLNNQQIAKSFANAIRKNDLENHFVYYRTQSIGEFLSKEVIKHDFDTLRLRPIFDQLLKTRKIKASYHLKYKEQDSLFNRKDYTTRNINTKAFPTYKWYDKENKYIYASFYHFQKDILFKIHKEVIGFFLLIIIVVFCLFLVFKALYNEKKLTHLKNDFISNITHELKTPVAVISAAIEAITDPDISLKTSQKNNYLQHSKKEVQNLSELIEKILEISFYEEGKVLLEPVRINYVKEIKNVIKQIKLLYNKNINIKIKNQTNTPFIFADKKQFIFAIKNILDNAMKYSRQEVNISIVIKQIKQSIHIEVKDDGYGINPNSLKHIFEKFYREPRKDHKIKGQGLGLYIVKGIMRAHKGEILIESKKNKYTKVNLVWSI